ncbi:sugar phosphate isomerase/epimerase family protein [Nguyenibacter vanlangensis]|uniref:Sugar phosphate isomerase/epimerase family protein n=1 Tax=Nguyenibacter vanlangensis TaxID=1216886 RepID=A0ABZ3D9F5_9PROT
MKTIANRIGIHGSVWSGRWDTDDGVRAMHETAAAGYDFLELPLSSPDGIAVAALRRAAQAAGIGLTASLGLSADTDISSDDPQVVKRGAALLDHAVSVLRDLGGTDLAGVIFSAMRKYDRPATERGIAHSAEVLRALAERAAQAGIRLHLEVVNRYESNLINTGAQAVAFIDKVGRPEIGVHLDTYHMNIEEGIPSNAIEKCADRIGYFHVGESHRGYLGTGTVAWGPVFRSLRRIAYTGPIAFESFSAAVVDPHLSHTLGVWRNLWEDGADLARHARAFIAAQMVAAEHAEGAA